MQVLRVTMASANKGQKAGAPADSGAVVVDPVLQLIFNDIRSRDAAVRTQGAEDLRLHVCCVFPSPQFFLFFFLSSDVRFDN